MSHTYDDVKRRAGSIMADCRTREYLLDNLNLVIYGHCMTDGSMFRCIKDFYDKTSTRKAVAEKMEIEIITLDGVYIYKFFSTYRTEDHSYLKLSFASHEAYVDYLKERVELSPVKIQREFGKNSRIISLITCTNVASEPDGRYVLTGILTEFISF
jgi:SrtB family sortase